MSGSGWTMSLPSYCNYWDHVSVRIETGVEEATEFELRVIGPEGEIEWGPRTFTTDDKGVFDGWIPPMAEPDPNWPGGTLKFQAYTDNELPIDPDAEATIPVVV